MSSTASSGLSKPAPWRTTFLNSLSKMDSPEFVLATVAPAASAPTPYLPRARYCIFRGMWAELPENDHNPAETNEKVYESDLPTFTTDIRMEKISQLFASSPGKDGLESVEQILGSGGGGEVEAVWWAKGEGVQWRLKGRAFVVGMDMDEGNDSGVRTVKSEVGERMRVVKGMEGKEEQWRWGKEITGHFGNMSPGMRGTFRAPPPGQRKDAPYDKRLKLGGKVEDLNDEIARKHFRVCIIKPDEVEKLFLADPTKAHRWRWTFRKEVGDWEEEELWP
ncbi:hypothetical protein NA57DRAFT_63841 [Rhizodiscina lignyota]|uniref:Pyridoxamine 5'-phosphate oxidase Alr4036 family FMN-binding domain-containing protein n=1 Tax=Rhizodiscina lignyota TaxID=1504668 RepID=A0A9P4IRZ9_9PEZI|nr:hypothetical protein NA57DRAFT_63841 [Rhizodiscina lignyota]